MSNESKKEHATAAGQYYLMEKVAQGGMAEIYKGLSYDVHGLKKTVCIKKILPHLAASNEFISSLVEEAKLAVKLVHGNIAQTYDLGKVGGDYFMVMEYVDGKSLSQINKKCLQNGKLIPIAMLIFFISEVLNGLGYMHRRADDTGRLLHIVHRDVSPQNIMVSYSGTVKIIDFGIAKAAYHVGSTDTGMLKGKFAYMSPEQALGDAVDARSDVFSAGIILHEMLTGKRLFKADDSRETIRNVRRSRVPPPSSVNPEIPAELDRIAIRALSKDRQMRYQSASEMHDDLVKFLYTNYPEFKPSKVATFVQELFRDEFESPQKMEADSRTPHLIIDRSNSALADDSQFEVTGIVKAPVNMSEYMIEETTADRMAAAEEGLEEDDEVENEDEDVKKADDVRHVKRQAKHKRSSKVGIKRHILTGLAAGSLAVIIAVIFHVQPWRSDKALPRPVPAPPPPATVVIVTTPPDSRIFIDGKSAGQGSPFTIADITPDTSHELSVERDGFIGQKHSIHPAPSETVTIETILEPVESPKATIEITSEPPGATVYIDDKETKYMTPVSIDNIKPGIEFTVGLYAAGHKYWSKSATLKGGETKSFDVALTKEHGSVYIDSSPARALVMLNGAPSGQTPLTLDNLESGKIYKIEIWEEGFKTHSTELKAVAGHKQEIRVTLEKIPIEPHKQETQPPAGPEKEKPLIEPRGKSGGIIDTPAPIGQ